MVYPVTLSDKLVRELQEIALRKKRAPEELIRRAVQEWVRQESHTLSDIERSRRLHARVKAGLRRRNPALQRRMTRRALVEQMEQLSDKVARDLPFATWQDAQSFARGEEHYDFVRQQHLSD